MAVVGFALLVDANFFFIGGVLFRRLSGQKCGHAPHGESAAAMARANEEARISVEKRFIHAHGVAIRQQSIGMVI